MDYDVNLQLNIYIYIIYHLIKFVFASNYRAWYTLFFPMIANQKRNKCLVSCVPSYLIQVEVDAAEIVKLLRGEDEDLTEIFLLIHWQKERLNGWKARDGCCVFQVG